MRVVVEGLWSVWGGVEVMWTGYVVVKWKCRLVVMQWCEVVVW